MTCIHEFALGQSYAGNMKIYFAVHYEACDAALARTALF